MNNGKNNTRLMERDFHPSAELVGLLSSPFEAVRQYLDLLLIETALISSALELKEVVVGYKDMGFVQKLHDKYAERFSLTGAELEQVLRMFFDEYWRHVEKWEPYVTGVSTLVINENALIM